MSSNRAPAAPSDRRRLRRLAWLGPAAVVLAATVWNAGAWAIDASALRQPAYSFGVTFATVIYTVLLGVPLLLLQLVVAGVATAAPTRGALATAVVLSTLSGFAMLVTGVVLLVTATADSDVAFGLVTLVTAAVLLAPGWWAWDLLAGPEAAS